MKGGLGSYTASSEFSVGSDKTCWRIMGGLMGSSCISMMEGEGYVSTLRRQSPFLAIDYYRTVFGMLLRFLESPKLK